SLRYLLPDPPYPILEMGNHALHPHLLLAHAILASTAMLIGPAQLAMPLRAAYPRLHRWLGRTYAALVFGAFLVSLFLLPTVATGIPASSAFLIDGLVWTGCTLLAVIAIRRGNVAAHRRWMLRGYAMALTAVTIRYYAFLAKLLDVPFAYKYPATLW